MTVERIELRIDGVPVGKGRPQFVRATGRTYTPLKTQVAEYEVKNAWNEAGSPHITGPIWLVLEVFVTRPAGHFKKDGTLSAEGLRHPYPAHRKPDLDNVLKLVADALNKLAFEDDVRIVEANLARRWADHPYIHLTIEPML